MLARQQTLALLFGALALADVEHEFDALVVAQPRGGTQRPPVRPIVMDVLNFIWCGAPGGLEFLEGLSRTRHPLWRRQRVPPYAIGEHIFTGVARHAQKGVIGPSDPAIGREEQNAHGLNFEGAAKARFLRAQF